MPKYGGVHYPNSEKGITDGNPKHIKDNNAKNKFGINTHVPNGRDTFGDFTTRADNDGATGKRRQDVLNQRSEYAWKQ